MGLLCWWGSQLWFGAGLLNWGGVVQWNCKRLEENDPQRTVYMKVEASSTFPKFSTNEYNFSFLYCVFFFCELIVSV